MHLKQILQQCNLFSGMTPAELKEVESFTSVVQLASSEYLFHEGDQANSFFLLQSGELQITKTDHHTGKSHKLAMVTPPEIIGEMSLIEGEPRSASAWAVEDSTLIVFDCDAIRSSNLITKMSQALNRILSSRLRRNNERTVRAMQRELDETKANLIKIKAANNKIDELNRNLEKKVEERTETIATILNNVKSGFFLIDKQLKLLPGFTKSCSAILKCQVEAGMDLGHMLQLSQRDAQTLGFFISLTFDDMMPVEATLGNLKTRYPIGDGCVDMFGSVIRDQSEKVVALLFTVNDSTDLQNAEEANRTARCLLEIMQNKKTFTQYVQDCRDKLDSCKQELAHSHSKPTANILADLHTLKGNSAIFDLNHIAERIHHLEEQDSLKVAEIQELEGMLQHFLQQHHSVLGLSYEDKVTQIFQIEESEINHLIQRVDHSPDLTHSQKMVKEWCQSIRACPAESYVGPIEKNVIKIAESLGKKARISLEGGDTLIDPQHCGEILQNIIHLVRNAVHHGIEEPDSRGSKDSVGTIKLSFCQEGSQIIIKIADDGGGIDTDRLVAKALAQNLYSADELAKMSKEQLYNLIFLPQFSTSDSVDQIAGRGVGMTALKRAVEACGGRIQITSEIGKGTTFTISFPNGVASTKSA